MDTGNYIKSLILSKNLSIRNFSEKSGISYDVICNAIYGKTKNPKVLVKIAKALQVDPDTIISSKDIKTTINTFIEVNSDDSIYIKTQNIIINRLEHFKVSHNNNLINKISYSIYYYIKQEKISDNKVIEKMIDAIILYGIMESKIKEK